MKPITLKIGRNEYKITESDVFLDNNVCIQLCTQSKEKSTWGKRPYPILSKKAIKQIDKYKHMSIKIAGDAFYFSIK